IGAWIGYSFGETWVLDLRLGAGGLVGGATDLRTSPQAVSHPALSLVESVGARFFYVAPEVRVGFRLTKRLALGVGLEVPVPGAAWPAGPFAYLPAGQGRSVSASFPAAVLASTVVPLFVPSLGARYDFY